MAITTNTTERTIDPTAPGYAAAAPDAAVVPDTAVGGSAQATRSIVVNGVRHVVHGDRITFEGVVGLADGRGTRSDGHTVAFTRGPVEAPEGLLMPGHGTVLVEDQVFHATATHEG